LLLIIGYSAFSDETIRETKYRYKIAIVTTVAKAVAGRQMSNYYKSIYRLLIPF